MANELEQRAYELNTEISDTSKRQPVSRGKKLGYIAAGVVAVGLVVGGILGHFYMKDLGKGIEEFGQMYEKAGNIIENQLDI